MLKVRFRDWLTNNEALPDDETLAGWIDGLRDMIGLVAERRDTAPRQFAATVAALVASTKETLALQVGDCAIVGRRGSDWDVICWPENGEYASSTYFVTDDPEPRLKIIRRPREHSAFALFSDGVGDLALLHSEREAHSKFFDPMMRPVDGSPTVGRLSELSGKLRTYLGSPSVCERTDDDKTLVLLSDA